MRRFLVLAFAVAATFSVLANNFIPVSAPTAEGVVAYRQAGPNGAARLSDHFVPTASAPIANAPAVPVQQPDLTAFVPHASASAASIENVRNATVPEGSFVSAQAIRPSANFVKRRLLTIPAVTLMPDALATITREHSVATSLDAAIAERLSFAPDAVSLRNVADLNESFAQTHSSSPRRPSIESKRETAEPDAAKAKAKFIPLTAGATNIFASVDSKPFARLPQIIPASGVSADNRSEHTAGIIDEASTERAAFEADVPRQMPVAATFVTAAFSAPSDSFFHRARYVVEPYAPVSADVLAVADNAHATTAASQEITEREAVDADTAVEPKATVLAALTEAPSADFERARFVPEPVAPVSVETLARTETHSTNNGDVVTAERSFDNVTAEAAPPQTYIPTFLTARADVPTAIFQRMGLVAMPEV
ncbi:MAG: hypothetical protein PSX80_01885, partial [bacterium]|nr:hypothetical protein [bacterium]